MQTSCRKCGRRNTSRLICPYLTLPVQALGRCPHWPVDAGSCRISTVGLRSGQMAHRRFATGDSGPQTCRNAAFRPACRDGHAIAVQRSTVHRKLDAAAADPVGVFNGNNQRPVRAVHPDLCTAPVPGESRSDPDGTALKAQAENALDGELPCPAGGSRVPRPAGLADPGFGAAHVGRHDIGFRPVEFRSGAVVGAADGVD